MGHFLRNLRGEMWSPIVDMTVLVCVHFMDFMQHACHDAVTLSGNISMVYTVVISVIKALIELIAILYTVHGARFFLKS
jgi:hypothetical protein